MGRGSSNRTTGERRTPPCNPRPRRTTFRPARPAGFPHAPTVTAAPSTRYPGLHARDTRRVYDELFGSAGRSLWAVSYAYFDGPRVFDRLARRMEAVPELNVTLLLNIHRGRRNTSSSEHLVKRFADPFWEKDCRARRVPPCPTIRRRWTRRCGGCSTRRPWWRTRSVFVTSANFTSAALDENMELGLLVRYRPLAQSVVRHLRGLIDRGMLRGLPE